MGKENRCMNSTRAKKLGQNKIIDEYNNKSEQNSSNTEEKSRYQKVAIKKIKTEKELKLRKATHYDNVE